MRSALRGGLPCPSRQPAPFRVADQVTVPSRTVPFGDHPVRVVSAEARSSTPLMLVTAPLAVSRIQLRGIVQVIFIAAEGPAAAWRARGRRRTCNRRVTEAREDANRRLLRARDAMDGSYAQPLDVSRLARIAHTSEAHFVRTFRSTFGETPHRYLQRRRIERAMFLLTTTRREILEICMDVGYTSLGTFGRTFREIVGETPGEYRRRKVVPAVPNCFAMAWTRPSSFGEAAGGRTPVRSPASTTDDEGGTPRC